MVHPFAVAVNPVRSTEAERALTWVALDDLLARVEQIRDGHLRILVLRAAHALSRPEPLSPLDGVGRE